MSKRGNNNQPSRDYKKAGDLNRKSSHEMRTNDGMRSHGINPNAKMDGINKEK